MLYENLKSPVRLKKKRKNFRVCSNFEKYYSYLYVEILKKVFLTSFLKELRQ